MASLAAVVVALRAAGTAVGWGFQFQEPLFVATVASVLVVFAINLFGVFEIGVDTGRLAGLGAQAAGSRRSFFDGLLAVVLATPCSAPFLGTAVGFAFAGRGARSSSRSSSRSAWASRSRSRWSRRTRGWRAGCRARGRGC